MDKHKLIEFIIFFPGFLFSLAWHESAHALIAFKKGDNTAKRLGRITLNPLPHMDPIGTLLLPIVGFFTGGFLIGWGVPVPVDYRNLKEVKRDSLYIALAGPVSNLILATLIALLIHALAYFYPSWMSPETDFNGFTLLTGIVQIFYLNLALAFFNLIPIHPLDGGKVLYGLLPYPYSEKVDRFLTQYGFILLMLLFISGIYRYIVGIPVTILGRWLLSW